MAARARPSPAGSAPPKLLKSSSLHPKTISPYKSHEEEEEEEEGEGGKGKDVSPAARRDLCRVCTASFQATSSIDPLAQ